MDAVPEPASNEAAGEDPEEDVHEREGAVGDEHLKKAEQHADADPNSECRARLHIRRPDEKAGDASEVCVHIGDDLDADVVPSRALGMRGIHLSRAGNSPLGPPVISTLNDLPALVLETNFVT